MSVQSKASNIAVQVIPSETINKTNHLVVSQQDISDTMDRYGYSDEIINTINKENLLPVGLLNRLHASYPQHSGFMEKKPFLFTDKEHYSGLSGFREVCAILNENGIDIGHIVEREFFVEVYRFLATRHSLNSINWDDYPTDSVFQLVFPQPKMINDETTQKYIDASDAKARTQVAIDYTELTNPHDGNQQLNKPWFENDEGEIEFLDGSQHKYPQCQLIFDKTTQNCFSFCTYCFRHAQVRGDEDMFIQNDIKQIHDYVRLHPEITDLLITGGDGGYMPASRLKQYIMPLIEDPSLLHVKNVRLATRSLTFQPEMILSEKYNGMLKVFDLLRDNGIQLAWMAHFSTPRELLNPSTIAAIRRLQHHGVNIRSQSPIMNHISLFEDDDGKVDIDKSAQNWIDLAEILGMMCVGFHSMYCARPTGEHHYYTAPLADIEQVFNKVYRSLASINRPSRHISMTISAGKLAILGTSEIGGEKCFALKFTESRNMKWMDKVFHAKFNETENTIDFLTPFDTEKYFFADELKQIEHDLAAALAKKLN